VEQWAEVVVAAATLTAVTAVTVAAVARCLLIIIPSIDATVKDRELEKEIAVV
jgi:hypothetical protein